MRNPFKGLVVCILAVIAPLSIAAPLISQARKSQVEKRPPSAGLAPKRELTGVWAGPMGSQTNAVPRMTPLGQERFNANQPAEGQLPTAATSRDPLNTCDPLGFPRNVLYETNGIAFAQMPDRVIQLFQYQRVWREIWTDGRALPKNVGAKGGPDPRWYGYSVGHWEDDHTFLVNTVGSDERSWLDGTGHPHSADLQAEERYRRLDHDTLEMIVTIDDPKIYTSPFVIRKVNFKWNPEQEFEEQLCVPSAALEYSTIIGDPAGNGAPAK
jgi:hypothetical protein